MSGFKLNQDRKPITVDAPQEPWEHQTSTLKKAIFLPFLVAAGVLIGLPGLEATRLDIEHIIHCQGVEYTGTSQAWVECNRNREEASRLRLGGLR